MRRLISGWTDEHVPVALALAVAPVGGAVSMALPAPYSLVGVGATIVTALGALFLDGFGGLVVGVAAAAALILGMRLGGAWTPQSFPTSLTLVLSLVVLGWLAGLVSGGIRERRERDRSPDGAAPAYGSLGLLTAEVAEDRLEEEVLRARRHHRPLTVVVIEACITDKGLPPAARDAAYRTVARLVESELRDTDVPFALGPEEVGAILPETDVAAAWEVVGPILDAATRATFAVREHDERRELVDSAELHVGLAGMSDQLPDAATLLAAARASARADRVQGQVSRHAAPETAT